MGEVTGNTLQDVPILCIVLYFVNLIPKLIKVLSI